jgi:hypothetical protein
LLKKAQVDLNSSESIDQKIIRITSSLTELEIKKILVVGAINGTLRRELSKHYSFANGISFDQAVGISKLNESVYQYCENSECAQEVAETFFANQGVRAIKKFLRDIKVAPAPMVSEFTFMIRGEEVKQKMIHIYNSNGHKEIIKKHYENLRAILSIQHPLN